MPAEYVRELSAGEILRSSLRLYRESFGTIVLAFALPSLPASLVSLVGIMQRSPLITAAGLLLGLVANFVSCTAITLCISDVCVGKVPNLTRYFLRTRAVAATLLWLTLLQCLAIGVGLVLFVIPGILFMFWFAFSDLVVVLEGRGARAALTRSRQLTKGFVWRNLLVSVGILVPIAFMLGLAEALALFVSGDSMLSPGGSWRYIGGSLLYLATSDLVLPIVYVSLILTYYDLRARKEGYDRFALAAELAR